MIRWLGSLLRQIVGRIKEIMSQSVYWLTAAMMLVPLSWAIMLWGFDKNNIEFTLWGFLMFVVGGLFWGAALYNLKKERKAEKSRQAAIDAQQTANLVALQGIIEQLKDWREHGRH